MEKLTFDQARQLWKQRDIPAILDGTYIAPKPHASLILCAPGSDAWKHFKASPTRSREA